MLLHVQKDPGGLRVLGNPTDRREDPSFRKGKGPAPSHSGSVGQSRAESQAVCPSSGFPPPRYAPSIAKTQIRVRLAMKTN